MLVWRTGLVGLATVTATVLGMSPALAIEPAETVWTVDVGGPDTPGLGGDTVIGPDGTTYATGRIDVADADSAMVTLALDPAGQTLWQTTLDSSLPANDEGRAMSLDAAAGRLYVTGIVHNPSDENDEYDWITVAYDTTDGSELWRRYIDGYGRGYKPEAPSAVVVDPARDRLYVTGTGVGRCFDADFVTVAYVASTGAGVWIQRYAGRDGAGCRNSLYDVPTGLAVDDEGNVYVTGNSNDYYGKGPLTTISYATDGTPRWYVRQSAGAKAGYRSGRLLVDLARAQLYVLSTEGYNYNDPDEAVRAYSTATGELLWTASLDLYVYGGLDFDLDPGTGTITVAGGSSTASPGGFSVTALDSAGGRLWLRRVSVPQSQFVVAAAVQVDPLTGATYVAGTASYLATPTGYPRRALLVGLTRDGVPFTGAELPLTEVQVAVNALASGPRGQRLSLVTSYGYFFDEVGWTVTAVEVP